MIRSGNGAWWRQPEVLARWSRDLLSTEMAQLRPGGWRWPAKAGDVHWVDDAGADSLELMALSSAWAERLDLRQEDELQCLMARPSWEGWQAAAQQRLQRDDGVMRFATSGSTGRARMVEQPLEELQQEVDCIAQRLQSGGPAITRIVSVVRSHHIYGFLFTVLLPLALERGSPAGRMTVWDAVQETPALVRSGLRPGDLLVAFPDWWALAVRDGSTWPAGITGVSSTAPCPPAVAQAAIGVGISRWIEVYGSTETAGVGWREDPQAPFELQPYWMRVGAEARPVLPLDRPDSTGEAVSAVDDQHDESMLQRVMINGRLGSKRSAPDRLRWTDARHFQPQGRRDGVVQVGGVNVDPEQVAQRLRAHPAVADAVVRLHGAGAGQRLKAFVVPAIAGDEPAEELMTWCRQQFVPAARPVHIRFGPALPRQEMGKLSDWDLDGLAL